MNLGVEGGGDTGRRSAGRVAPTGGTRVVQGWYKGSITVVQVWYKALCVLCVLCVALCVLCVALAPTGTADGCSLTRTAYPARDTRSGET